MSTAEKIPDLELDKPQLPNLCAWVRDNVSTSKLHEAMGFLSQYEDYFDIDQHGMMVEHVYRGIKNSKKIEYAYDDALLFARWLVYLLSPDKKSFDVDSDLGSDMLKVVKETSFLYNFFLQLQEARGRVEKRGSYLLFDKATLTYLGSAVLWYYILHSVVSVAEKALNSEGYRFRSPLRWEEAIPNYVLAEVVSGLG